MCLHQFIGEVMVTESPRERRQAGGCSVKLWAMLC